jgi:hypothetical protein
MPYDPRSANAARLKMFHLIADKIERAEFFRNLAPFAGVLDTKKRRTVSEISPFAHRCLGMLFFGLCQCLLC